MQEEHIQEMSEMRKSIQDKQSIQETVSKMRYTIEKRKALKRNEQRRYILKYQKWLERQRIRDKETKYPNRYATANVWLRRNKCPHCRQELIDKREGDVVQKICKKHGVLQVRK